MASVTVAYTTTKTVTCTITSLANSATVGRESTVVSNSTVKYLDAQVVLKAELSTGTAANDKAVYVYAYGGSTTLYTGGNLTGADAASTMRNPTSLRLIGVCPTPTAGLDYIAGPFSVANAFGGVLPPRWGVFVRNYSGVALTANSTGNFLEYHGVTATVV